MVMDKRREGQVLGFRGRAVDSGSSPLGFGFVHKALVFWVGDGGLGFLYL